MHLVSARAGSTHLRYATPWQARWHVTVLPLRFSTGGSRGRKPDSRQSPKPTFGRSGTMPPLTRRLTIKNRLRSIKSVYV